MSKSYKVDMKLDTSKLTPGGGILMKNVDKEVDARGFKENTGAEVFSFIAIVAINGANPRCSYQQLKNFRRIVSDLNKAAVNGEYISNKTDMEIIKNSIKGNKAWPNQDEILNVVDSVIAKIDLAEEINENSPA